MKRNKSFDCVQMKNQIYKSLEKEYKGLTDEQIWDRINNNANTSNNSIWVWWRKIRDSQKKSSRQIA